MAEAQQPSVEISITKAFGGGKKSSGKKIGGKKSSGKNPVEKNAVEKNAVEKNQSYFQEFMAIE